MKEYTFNVSVVDTYTTRITVMANSKEEAIELVEKDVEACPIEGRSNTLSDSDLDIELTKIE